MGAIPQIQTVLIALVSLAIVGCQPSLEREEEAQTTALDIALSPAFLKESGWGRLPNDWVFGDVSGVAIDEQDNVWVLHRPRSVPEDLAARAAPPVVVFDSGGNFINAWGGPGNGYTWPQQEHGIHVDHKGFVWIGGNHCAGLPKHNLAPVDDDQILKFTRAGEFVLQIGNAGQSVGNADTENLDRPAAMAVHDGTNELIVADGYGNHRVIVFDADTGAYKRMWGAFGNAPEDDNRCGPEFSGPDAPSWNPDQFSIVHALVVADDGLVYVVDREHARIQIFTVEGTYLTEIEDSEAGTLLASVALSPGPGQDHLYIWWASQIQVRDRQTLDLITTVSDDPTTQGPGHLMTADSKGNLYLARLAGGIEKLMYQKNSSH